MDNFREEIVVRRNRLLNDLLYVMAWILIVVFGFVALMLLQSTVMVLNFNVFAIGVMLATGAIAVLLFLKKDVLRTEYEYTFTNGELDFARVYGNNKRKELGSMRVKNVDACGWVAGPSFQRYVSMPGIRKDNWFLNRDANLFYFYFVKDGSKRIIVIEPSKEMADLIRQYAAHGAFQG